MSCFKIKKILNMIRKKSKRFKSENLLIQLSKKKCEDFVAYQISPLWHMKKT